MAKKADGKTASKTHKNGNGNRISGLMPDGNGGSGNSEHDDNGEAEHKPAAAEDPKPENGAPEKPEDGKKKKATAEIVKARSELYEKAFEVAKLYSHHTEATGPNTNGREIIMKKDAKSVRGLDYEITACVQTSMSVGATVLETNLNEQVLRDEHDAHRADVEKSREASHMSQTYISGSVIMVRDKVFDVNAAMRNSRHLDESADESQHIDRAQRWATGTIRDWYESEPHGNKNTARGGTPPILLMVDMGHRQSPNLLYAFERPVKDDGIHSESDVAMDRLLRLWRKIEDNYGEDLEKELVKRGWDGTRRVSLLSLSEAAPEIARQHGLGDCVAKNMSEVIANVERWIEETTAVGDKGLPRFITIRMLKFRGPGNPNRQSNGRPKETIVGGVARAMWTSQAENAGARAVSFDRGDPYAIRTPQIVKEILMEMNEESAAAREAVAAFVHHAFGPVRAIVDPLGKDKDNWRTASGYFVGTDAIDRAVKLLLSYWTSLAPLGEAAAKGVEKVTSEYFAATAV